MRSFEELAERHKNGLIEFASERKNIRIVLARRQGDPEVTFFSIVTERFLFLLFHVFIISNFHA
jgi:hypothetical protein